MRNYQELVPDAPERFFAIVESQTVAPSKRYDKLVDAEIEEARKGRISAVSLMTVFFLAAVVFFALGNNVAGGLLLSIPVLGFFQALLPAGGKSKLGIDHGHHSSGSQQTTSVAEADRTES